MLPKRIFRVVAGLDLEKKTLDEARKRARPILKEWLRRIELDVMAGRLAALDFLMAKELCNYPSANEGRCFAGQKRLGAAVGSCARTAGSSLSRLRDRGFLFSKRGGPGRTASWTFCVNGKPIFGGAAFLPCLNSPIDNTQHSALDRQHVACLDRQHVADKPFELEPVEHKPSPPYPPATAERVDGSVDGGTAPSSPAGEPKEERYGRQEGVEASSSATPCGCDGARAVDGQILTGEISFQEFWLASGRRGHEGFARGEWRKLPLSDKAAISDRLQRDGELRLGSLWAGTWLRDRVWEEPDPPIEKIVSHVHRIEYAAPGSELWRAERERLRMAGDPFSRDAVKLMDEFAAAGKGWSVRLP